MGIPKGERKAKKKIKHLSTKSLHKKAWKLVSEYKRREADGVCFTCGNKYPWKEMQCGHYIHKKCMDFVDENLHCQCVRCNKWLSGNLGMYTVQLIKKYGIEKIGELQELAKQDHKFTVIELLDIIELWKNKLNSLNHLDKLIDNSVGL